MLPHDSGIFIHLRSLLNVKYLYFRLDLGVEMKISSPLLVDLRLLVPSWIKQGLTGSSEREAVQVS